MKIKGVKPRQKVSSDSEAYHEQMGPIPSLNKLKLPSLWGTHVQIESILINDMGELAPSDFHIFRSGDSDFRTIKLPLPRLNGGSAGGSMAIKIGK